MAKKNLSMDTNGSSRRTFLQTVGMGMPALTVMLQDSAGDTTAGVPPAGSISDKFTPIDLSGVFNASATDIGPSEYTKGRGATRDGLLRLPGGQQAFYGTLFGSVRAARRKNLA